MAEPSAAAAGTITISGDVTVNRLGFGAMRLCGGRIWGEPADPANARAVLRRAVELGIELIDTADAYGPEVNERQIADALQPYAERVAIATKGGGTRASRDHRGIDGRPAHLREACEASLLRLRLERIDLYQLDGVDPAVPIEESVGALSELRDDGKVRHIGVSNVNVGQLSRARSVAPIASVQNPYNVSDRRWEEVLEACQRDSMAFLAYFPLGAGWRAARPGPALEAVGRKHGATPMQIALAWLLHRSPVLLPIPGTSSLTQLEENVAAAALTLDDEDLAALG